MAAIGGPQKRTGMGPVHSPAAVTIPLQKDSKRQTTPKGTRHPNDSDCPGTNRRASPRTVEEWERNVCENKVVAILNKCKMLIAIVLDKPLSEAQALVDDPDAFMLEITNHSNKTHLVIAQMLHPDVRDDLPPSECTPASSEGQSSRTATADRAQPQTQFQ